MEKNTIKPIRDRIKLWYKIRKFKRLIKKLNKEEKVWVIPKDCKVYLVKKAPNPMIFIIDK